MVTEEMAGSIDYCNQFGGGSEARFCIAKGGDGGSSNSNNLISNNGNGGNGAGLLIA